MLRLFKIAMLWLLLAGLMGCIEDVDIDLGTEEAIAVDCVLRNRSTQTLRLYRLKEVYGADARAIEDASVTLWAYDNEAGEYSEVAKFQHHGGTEWRTEYEPKHGVRYKLSVRISGNKEITAETTFPEDLRLIVVKRKNDSTFPEGDNILPYAFGYEVRKAKNVWSISDPDLPPWSRDFKYVNGVKVQFRDYSAVYKDSCKIWIYPHVEAERDSIYPPGIPNTGGINLYLYPEFYDFYGHSKPYVKYVATDHPYVDDFNLTPGTVRDMKWCNIDDYAYRRLLRQWPLWVCPDLLLHDSFLRIAHPANFVNRKYQHELDDEQNSGIQKVKHYFYIIADCSKSFGYNYTIPAIPDTLSWVVEAHFVSEEYDSYLKDVYTSKDSVDDFILSAYDVKHISSNVNGGYGIFGADYVTWAQEDPAQFGWLAH